MKLPEWVIKRIEAAFQNIPNVQFGKVTLVADIDFAGGGIGSARVKVSHEETFRPKDA